MIQRERQYFQNLLSIFKSVSFHELYMQGGRQQLCKDQYYDPRTAFKCLDSFKHNKVIAYQLFSFFEMHRIESTAEECQQIIKALNKTLGHIEWDSFQELTLPKNMVVRNYALARYSNIQIQVGSYSKLNYVKEHSQHLIALFLQKELNFCREFLFLRQQFCRQWGGDVYTMLQKLFKNQKKNKFIQFQQFFLVAREYGMLFNKNEFYALWKRSKNKNQRPQDMAEQIRIQFDNLLSLLLVNNFKTKSLYGLQRNIPIEKSMKKLEPSYKISHWRQHQKWQQQQKKQQLKKLQQINQIKKYDMKYRFSYPQLVVRPHIQARQKEKDWQEKVNQMSDRQLIAAYHKLTIKKTIFRQ